MKSNMTRILRIVSIYFFKCCLKKKKKKIQQAPSIILNQFLLNSFKSPYQIECFYTTRHKQTKGMMKGISISK